MSRFTDVFAKTAKYCSCHLSINNGSLENLATVADKIVEIYSLILLYVCCGGQSQLSQSLYLNRLSILGD